MDDKLYYVEGPDGDILGPINMIHILEGIAAGKVLEAARICEVGQQFWVSLSDIAYTRDEVDGPNGEASESLEFDLGPIEDVEEFEDLDALEASATFEPWTPRAEGAPLAAAPDPEPTFHEPAPAEPFVAEPLLVEPAFTDAEYSQPADSVYASEPEPEMAIASGAPHEPRRSDFDTTIFQPSPSPEGADDFALEMIEGGDAAHEHDGAPRRRWLLPAAIALGVPVIAGIYVMAGGSLPFFSRSPDPGATQTPPAASTSTEADGSRLGGALRLFASGSTAEAKLAFEKLVADDPDNAAAHAGLARVAAASGDREFAVAEWTRASELEPKNAEFWLERGRAHLEWKQAPEAESAAQSALAIDRNAPGAILLLARARAVGGDRESAAQELSKYVKAVPDDMDVRRELAMTLAAVGRTEAAIAEIDAYLVQRPDDREAQFARVDWMVSLGKLSDAGRVYAQLAEENPSNGYYQYLAGLAHPKTEEGVEYLQMSVQLSPANGDAHGKLGEYLAALGRRGDAVAALQRSASIRPAPANEKSLLAELERTAAPAPAPVATATPDVAQTKQVEPEPPARVAESTRAPAPAASKPDASATLAARIGRIRAALTDEKFADARSEIASTQSELAASEETTRNLAFWLAVCDAEQGEFDTAIEKFEALDPDASYSASGLGRGAVRNWLAKIYLVKGDVRSAVAVFDQIGPDDPDEYAVARLWEGVAVASLGMDDLAGRTWGRVSADVGARVSKKGRAAVKSAEYLAGAITEKEYQTAVAPISDFENDMHYLIAYDAFRKKDAETARQQFLKSVQSSRGKEFPFHLAEAEMSGTGLTTP